MTKCGHAVRLIRKIGICIPDRYILLAVQNDALFVSQFPRPVWLLRHFGNFQQSRDLFTASIQTARSLFPNEFTERPAMSKQAIHDRLQVA